MRPSGFAVPAIAVLLVAWLVGVSPMAIEPNVIRVPQDYQLIQQAIEEANPGDVIQVASGTYSENLKIDKPLRLVGEGPDKTIIAKAGTIVQVKNTYGVEIEGFSVQNGTYGIFLWYSQNILLKNNKLSNNKWSFGVWGTSISQFVHDIDPSNTVDGKPMYFWVHQHGKQVPTDAGYVALVNSTNITVRDTRLTSNEQGLLLISTNNSVIENVTMSGNDEGIDMRMSHNNVIRENQLLQINWRAVFLQDSNNNAFYGNTVLNSTYALSIQGSNANIFYHNNLINNTVQVYQETSQTIWYNEDVQEGNYWSDYTSVDTDGDGVGDTPYIIPGGQLDRYPLINPRDATPPRANAGQNQTVNTGQAVAFDASNSTDNIGIVSYEWNFGDDTTATGIATTHIYASPETYTVVLTVKDASGNLATDTVIITVVQSPLPSAWWIPIIGLGAGAVAIIAVVFWRRRSSRE